MLVFRKSRLFLRYCCLSAVVMIYDLGAEASPDTVAGTQMLSWCRWTFSPISSGGNGLVDLS